jgi:hypothetical protein
MFTFSAVARCSFLQFRQLWPIHVARVWPPRKRHFLKAKPVCAAMPQ